jgi:steroid delta-isomerase-like uncharacterized protein
MRRFVQFTGFLILAMTFALPAVLSVGCGGGKMTQEEENKAIVRQFWQEGWKQENQAVFDEICAVDYVNHDPNVPEVIDLNSYKQHVALHVSAFHTDKAVEVDEMVAEGDKVAARWIWRVAHKGEYMGIPPSGNQLTLTGITFHRLAEGKVAENWHQYDALGFMQQLGVVPPMGREDFTWGQSMEPVATAPSDLEANKAAYIREAEELWNEGNLDVLDDIFSADFVNYDPSWPGVTDRESFREWGADWLSTAPDVEIVIEDIVGQGDMVAGRWISRWTDVAGVAGSQPTGKQIEVTGMDICRIANGKIVERWWAKDVLGAMQQLDIVPPLVEESEE